jgi:2'-5' RNA ligase
MAETAIVVLVPELEALVGSIWNERTSDGARGMPPHVTVLYPFVDDGDLAPAVPLVERALARSSSFEVAFRRAARFPETLYLVPEPGEPFVEITRALVDAFPGFPPYAGAFEEIVPHLTVAHGEPGRFDAIEREVTAALPVRVRVERAWLMTEHADRWQRHIAFPLDGH